MCLILRCQQFRIESWTATRTRTKRSDLYTIYNISTFLTNFNLILISIWIWFTARESVCYETGDRDFRTKREVNKDEINCIRRYSICHKMYVFYNIKLICRHLWRTTEWIMVNGMMLDAGATANQLRKKKPIRRQRIDSIEKEIEFVFVRRRWGWPRMSLANEIA